MRSCFAAFFCVVVLLSPCVFALQSNSWRAADLPSRPVAISSAGSVLWACGADELIAESKDGGQSWNVKHRNENGSVLLTIGFADDENGFAAGTGGKLLLTQDGGATWAPVHTDGNTIYNASFSDGHNGMIQTPSAIEYTHDGGATWNEVSFLKSGQDLKKFQFVLALAVVDSNRMAILLKEGPAAYYDQRIIVTNDGGKNWKTENLEHATLRTLLVRDGSYWALGTEVIDTNNRGGHAVSLAMHSSDAENWVKQPRPAREIEACTSGGCLLWDGAGVNPFVPEPSYWTFPPIKSMSTRWAVTKSTICIITGELQCAAASPSSTVPAHNNDTPIPAVITPPALGAPTPSGLHCLLCPAERIIVDQKYSGIAEIDLDLTVATNGTVSQVTVLKAPTPDIGARFANAAESWVFEPYVENGAPVQVHTTIKLKMQVIKSR